jgi:putative oxidoreductase
MIGSTGAAERRTWSSPSEWTSLTDVGLLVLRLVLGFELFAHGMQKFGLFGGTVGFDGKEVTGSAAVSAQAGLLHLLGYHPTTAMSWFLTLTELGAGSLLIAGFLTPLAAAALIGDMFNVVAGMQWQSGWFGNANGPGYEFAVVILGAAAAVSLIGPGRFSVDRALGWRLSGVPWGVAGVALGLAVGLLVLVMFGPGFGGADLSPPSSP